MLLGLHQQQNTQRVGTKSAAMSFGSRDSAGAELETHSWLPARERHKSPFLSTATTLNYRATKIKAHHRKCVC